MSSFEKPARVKFLCASNIYRGSVQDSNCNARFNMDSACEYIVPARNKTLKPSFGDKSLERETDRL